MKSYIIEGLDRLGKSTLIEGILHKEGYHQVIHYAKPQLLECYKLDARPLKRYQLETFKSMLYLLDSKAPLILDRAHLGEYVYAPMYRKYDAEYIFQLEKYHRAQDMEHVQLILLTEDFSKSKHFVDDGLSLGSEDKRETEQQLFIEAFNKSTFKNKKMICVTAEDGSFRSKEEILAEATQ